MMSIQELTMLSVSILMPKTLSNKYANASKGVVLWYTQHAFLHYCS